MALFIVMYVIFLEGGQTRTLGSEPPSSSEILGIQTNLLDSSSALSCFFSFCITLLYIASVREGVQYLSANNNLITAELVHNPDRVMEQSALPELRLRLYVNFIRTIALEDPSLMVSHRRSKSPLAQRQ